MSIPLVLSLAVNMLHQHGQVGVTESRMVCKA